MEGRKRNSSYIESSTKKRNKNTDYYIKQLEILLLETKKENSDLKKENKKLEKKISRVEKFNDDLRSKNISLELKFNDHDNEICQKLTNLEVSNIDYSSNYIN